MNYITHKKFHLFFLVLGLFVSSNVSMCYAEFRVATLDVAKVLDSSEQAKSAKAKFESSSKKAKELVESKRAALKPLHDKMRAGKIDPQSEEGKKLEKDTKDLFQLMQSQEDSLREEFAKSNKVISDQVGKVVSSYAKEKGINLVLEKGKDSRGGVLFAVSSFDITEDIISRINK